MNNQNERIGSLMALSDIALLLSTYGVLLVFNFFVEPIGMNTWIVCTFFVGIKILIVGIADVTGIGKNFLVSIVFLIIANAVTFLINQLMVFGLSIRLLLVMLVVDIIFLLIALYIWRALGKRQKSRSQDWVYEENKSIVGDEDLTQKTIPQDTAKNEETLESLGIKDEVLTTPLEEVTAVETTSATGNLADISLDTQEDVFDFGIGSGDDNFFQETEKPSENTESFLRFEDLTSELDQDEINAQIENEEMESPIVEAYKEVEKQEEPEEVSETIEIEPEEEVIEETTPVVEEIEPEPEIEEVKEEESEVEETQIEEVSEEPEPEIIEEPEEEIAVTIPEEVEEELEETEEETEPVGIITEDRYVDMTGVASDEYATFTPLSVDLTQEEIDNSRDQLRVALIDLNKQINILIKAFNRSVSRNNKEERIESVEELTDDMPIQAADRLIRLKLKAIIDKQFVDHDVLHNLINKTNRYSNQAYSLEVANSNLQEHLELERQREKEKEERLKAQEEEPEVVEEEIVEAKPLEETIEELEKEPEIEEVVEEAEPVVEEIPEEVTIKQHNVPYISNEEVRLTADGLDIIIKKEDLEILKQFLNNSDVSEA